MTRAGAGARAYARAVERALEECAGRPAVLSPRDWSLLSDWFDRGVRLEVVLEALEEAAGRRRRGRGSRRLSLGYLAAAVDERHRAWVDGRATRPEAGESPLPPRETVRAAWAAASARGGAALSWAIAASIGILERGGSPEEADDALDEALPEAVPPELGERARAESERALSPFRARMDAAAFRATLRRAVADRLRRALDLPRIALTRSPGAPGDPRG